MNPEKRIAELRGILQDHNYRYYVMDDPTIPMVNMIPYSVNYNPLKKKIQI